MDTVTLDDLRSIDRELEFYPRGENRQRAVKAWDKLKPDDAMIDTMARALVRQKASPDWQRGIGIPHASTWLNGRRWEDEIGREAPDAPPGKTHGTKIGRCWIDGFLPKG